MLTSSLFCNLLSSSSLLSSPLFPSFPLLSSPHLLSCLYYTLLSPHLLSSSVSVILSSPLPSSPLLSSPLFPSSPLLSSLSSPLPPDSPAFACLVPNLQSAPRCCHFPPVFIPSGGQEGGGLRSAREPLSTSACAYACVYRIESQRGRVCVGGGGWCLSWETDGAWSLSVPGGRWRRSSSSSG